MGELIDNIEHSVLAGVVGAVLDEVVGPDVIRAFRAQADAGAVGKPQAATFRLLMGDLKPLPSPDTLDPPITDRPPSLAQQCSDLSVAVATILARQLNDVGRQPFGILSAPRGFTLRRAMLPERRTRAALGDLQIRSNVIDAGASAGGA